ncbi:MAG TPA: hypothetical protein VF453_15695 [Burkholderiaceae bacterium]
MTHDRVMRFEPTFRSRGQALRFAWIQARAWLDAQAPTPAPIPGGQ